MQTLEDWAVVREQHSLWIRVRGNDADEFAGRDYLRILPELWKMPCVAGDQVVGAGGVGAFEEAVVVAIRRNVERTRRVNQLRAVPYELEELLPKAEADFQFRGWGARPVGKGTTEAVPQDFRVDRVNPWLSLNPSHHP